MRGERQQIHLLVSFEISVVRETAIAGAANVVIPLLPDTGVVVTYLVVGVYGHRQQGQRCNRSKQDCACITKGVANLWLWLTTKDE